MNEYIIGIISRFAVLCNDETTIVPAQPHYSELTWRVIVIIPLNIIVSKH